MIPGLAFGTFAAIYGTMNLHATENQTSQESLPPPLPLSLCRIKRPSKAWVDELPESARRVLENTATTRESWPQTERLSGAIAHPIAIPSSTVEA